MSPRKYVRRPKKLEALEELCLPFVAVHLKDIVDNHCERAEFKEDKMTEDLKIVLGYVPPILHDQVAESLLTAVVKIYGDRDYTEAEIDPKADFLITRKLLGRRKRDFERRGSNSGISKNENESRSLYPDNKPHFHRLMSVFDHLKIKRLTIGSHPAYMERKLSELMGGMTGLEVFHCTNSWMIKGVKAFDFGKLSTACHPLSNLTSFTLELCTDKILSAICDSCRALRLINVKRREDWPYYITDDSIPGLVKCENLEMINLENSLVSPDGFEQLLFETKSKGLVEIEGFQLWTWNFLLNKIEDRAQRAPGTFRTFQLKTLTWNDPDKNRLNLIVNYFPLLTEVSFDCYKPPSHRDFSILSGLTRLRSVKIKFYNCGPDDVREVLSTCPHITSIDVHWGKSVSEFSLWLNYISKFCLDIEELSLHQQNEDKEAENISRVVFAPNSFQKLRKFKSYGSALLDTQQVLSLATNMNEFSFASPSVLSDEFFETVLKQHPLSRLKNLRLSSTGSVGTRHCRISGNMAKRIIASCEQLTNFYLHFPFGFNKEENSQLQKWIHENNYDVEFKIYGLW